MSVSKNNKGFYPTKNILQQLEDFLQLKKYIKKKNSDKRNINFIQKEVLTRTWTRPRGSDDASVLGL